MSIRRAAVAFSLSLLVAIIGLAGCGGGGGDTPPQNHDPTINSLTSADAQVWPSQGTTVTVTASDQDGDSLSYAWTTSGGTINGSGTQITWVAPTTTGDHTVTVTVIDGQGGQAQQSVTINVDDIGPPPPPPF